jgi:N-acetylneuraminate synthase
MSIKLGKLNIGLDAPPFIIAEMSGNHNQSLDSALNIVDAVAECGVSALKIQTYKPETMTLNLDTEQFRVAGESSLWRGETLFELYKKAHTPWEWHEEIYSRAKAKGLMVFSTPFDDSAVVFLESINTPLYKIASFEITDLKLIECVAKTRKPVIISTGMASISEISDAVEVMERSNNSNYVLLKCTSSYPATPKFSNIKTIPNLRETFGCEVGLSDHTLGMGVAIASISLGASVIEKHFTLNRLDGGVDSKFSMEPHEMIQLVLEANRAHQAMGSISYGVSEQEKESIQFRRSLYISKAVKAGEILTKENVRAIRPGFGLEIKYYDIVIGRRAREDFQEGTPLAWGMIA